MSRKTTSLRGEVVDFDLFDIKQQISGAVADEKIENRARFIDLRRRRGGKRKVQDMLAEQEAAQRQVTEALNNKEAVENTDEPQGAAPEKRKIVKKDA
jgi:hypothetical protein